MMTEAEAFEVAKQYIASINQEYVSCFRRGLVSPDQLRVWCGEYGVLKGQRSKVWLFGFKIEELPNGTVSTGNAFIMLVDDATKECGIKYSM